MYALYSILGISILGFIFLDGPKIVKEVISAGKSSQKEEVKSDDKQQPSKIKTICKNTTTLCVIVSKIMYMNLTQRLNKTVKKIDKNNFEVTYVISGKMYKMVVKNRRGPSAVLLVYDKEHQDVSNIILPYLGPQQDFHGRKFTPKFFGKDKLIFEMSSGEEKSFGENEVIILS